MDYASKSKEEIIEILQSKKISFNSNKSKEELIELLLDYDNRPRTLLTVDSRGGIGRVGAILNIIFASISTIILIILGFSFMWVSPLAIIFLLFAVGPIATVNVNSNYLRGKNNKLLAGILGIIFAWFVGGILVLIGNNDNLEMR